MSSRHDEIYVGVVEATDQLDPNESLAGEINDDPLDAGYSPPEHQPANTRWGNTEAEIIAGRRLDERLADEVPEVSEEDLDLVDEEPRAGRLVAADQEIADDEEGLAIAFDVGRAGWAASAEEAAVHIRRDI